MTTPRKIRALQLFALISFFVGPSFSSTVHGQSSVILEGLYQGKNLYVQNPNVDSGGYSNCIDSVMVNGIRCMAAIHLDAFEIKLDSMNWAIGTELSVIIFHQNNCTPKVLPPTMVNRKFCAQITKTNLNEHGLLQWTIRENTWNFYQSFSVEQFKWNKWVKLGEVTAPDSIGGSAFSFKVTALHSGENKLRLKHISPTCRPCYYNAVKTENSAPTPTFQYDPESQNVIFSRATAYEVYNAYGDLIAKGHDAKIDCSAMEYGTHYLNYDRELTKFKIKKPRNIGKP